jgi:hypothetical protein
MTQVHRAGHVPDDSDDDGHLHSDDDSADSAADSSSSSSEGDDVYPFHDTEPADEEMVDVTDSLDDAIFGHSKHMQRTD